MVPGNTLWGLSQTYYGNPYGWERILDANRDLIEHPDVLPRGVELSIPSPAASPESRPATVSTMRISGPPGARAGEPSTGGPVVGVSVITRRPPDHASPDTEAAASSPSTSVKPAVSEGAFLRAPWLVALGTRLESSGVIGGFADSDRAVVALQPFDRVRIRVEGSVPSVGSELQAFRVTRTDGELGQIVKPTGTLTVVAILPQAVVAQVESVFSRMGAEDLVRPVPVVPMIPGGSGFAVSEGLSFPAVGFEEMHPVKTLGDHVFLHLGPGGGLRSGDVLEVVSDDASLDGRAGGGAVEVVAVHEGYATARITSLENPVFRSGVVLRLSRRMQ